MPFQAAYPECAWAGAWTVKAPKRKPCTWSVLGGCILRSVYTRCSVYQVPLGGVTPGCTSFMRSLSAVHLYHTILSSYVYYTRVNPDHGYWVGYLGTECMHIQGHIDAVVHFMLRAVDCEPCFPKPCAYTLPTHKTLRPNALNPVISHRRCTASHWCMI